MDALFQSISTVLINIQDPPGVIIGPISFVFGHIINFIYAGISAITPVNALGISIIIMTILVRTPLIPNQIKMLQTSKKSQLAKPEMDKIREKYGNTKDPELRRKMQAEIQAVNQKYGINMLASCLPMLVSMPIFIALFSVFGRAFLFIPSFTDAYSALSQTLIDLGVQWHQDVLAGILRDFNNIVGNTSFSGAGPSGVEGAFYSMDVGDMNRVIHLFTPEHWQTVFDSLTGEYASHLPIVQGAYDARQSMQSFFGLDLVTPSGWAWPGIIIPILSTGTMVYSTWQNQKMNPATDPQQKMMQRMMMFVMPLMFGWFTVQAASAVGLYWTAGNVFLIAQNLIVFKFFPHKLDPKAPSKDKKAKDRDRR
ncbi:MAG: YidC/Oxa1 family membrane protein insertase [Defluviitaleaceae bacterium]|nr:YidC/Oxa1 family membrane protein insertase [Defluviitaleaceae bacterium]